MTKSQTSIDYDQYAAPQAPRACTHFNTFAGAPDKKYQSFWPRGKVCGTSTVDATLTCVLLVDPKGLDGTHTRHDFSFPPNQNNH